MSFQLKRSSTILRPDQSRVLLRRFTPGDAQRMAEILATLTSFNEPIAIVE